jgi:hypothetical protein
VTAEGVLQIVVRSRQVRELVALEQAGPVALAHLQEVSQARSDRRLRGCGRRLTHPPQQLHQPPTHVLGRQPLLVLQKPGHTLDPPEGLPHRRPQCGGLLQTAPQQVLQTLQSSGQIPRQGRHAIQARGDAAQSPVQFQSGARQRRQPVVRQGGTYGGAVVPYDLRLLIVLPRLLRLALDGPDAAHTLLQFLLRMAIGLGDRLGRLAEIVEMAELVGDLAQGLGNRITDALLAIGDHAGDRHWQGLAHFGDQSRQVHSGG